jgi:hypothetical protein
MPMLSFQLLERKDFEQTNAIPASFATLGSHRKDPDFQPETGIGIAAALAGC